MNYSQNLEFSSPDFTSKIRFSFPFKNRKPNNISFKNSIHMMNSEKKPDNHRQYLIDFIRDNNNKNRKSPTPRQTIEKPNLYIDTKLFTKKNEEIIDKNIFYNDYFNQQIKIEKNNYNKLNSNKLLDIIDYIGEDARRPIDLEIMDIKMHNFLPGRISSKSFGLINSYAANTNQGIDRNYNDDRVKIMINMNRPSNYSSKAPWPLISYFAIFDGHNGDHCAEYLRQNLLQFIYTNPNFPKNIEKSIREAFIKADKAYLNNYALIKDDINNNINYNLDYCNNSGSCGLILLLIDTKIYIANVGDSRCIISCNNGKIQKDVTRDHKPEFPYEKKRIYNNGGNIYRNETIFQEDFLNKLNNKILLGPYRVNPGKLSVSRTIGDARAKMEKFGGIPNIIIPEPDIYAFDFYKDNIDYFILGCDGIFDRLKSKEVFECANVIINKSKELIEKKIKYNHCFSSNYDKKINMNTTCGNIVDMILRAAMLRKSYDNVTCIIIAFKDLLFGNNSKNENGIELNRKELYDSNENTNILNNNKSNYIINNKNKNKDITINNSNKKKNNTSKFDNSKDDNDNDNEFNNTNNNNNFDNKNSDNNEFDNKNFDNNKYDKNKNDNDNNNDNNNNNNNNNNDNNKFDNNNNNNNEQEDIHNYTYKAINKINNRYNNNFIYIAKDNNNGTKSENYDFKYKSENKNGVKPHRRIPSSQSQEKKIRELISLFSISNKKGTNNDNSKLLYRSYNSKNDIIKDQKNHYKSKIFFNKSNLEINDNNKDDNNKKNNISIYQDDIQKKSATSKDITVDLEKENIRKMKKMAFMKKNNLDLRNSENNKNNYSYINKYKSITKQNNDYNYRINMNSFSSLKYNNKNNINENEKENNKYINDKINKNNNEAEKTNIYNYCNINTKMKSSKDSVYETPTRKENFTKRITTRKIVRKTNNIFNMRNNLNEKIDNNNYNLTLNNDKNNFFYSITSENRENIENTELEKNTNDKLNTIKKPNINSSTNLIKNNSINNYDKQKNRNIRYHHNLNLTKDYQLNLKEKIDNVNNNLRKSGKYEKIKKIEIPNIPLSSSVGIIYTKKNKIKQV